MSHITSQIASAWLDGSGGGAGFKTIAVPILGSSYLLLLLPIGDYFKPLKIYQPDFNPLWQAVGSGSLQMWCRAVRVHAGAGPAATALLQPVLDGEVAPATYTAGEIQW